MVALRTGLDGFLAFPTQAGGGDKVYHWPNIPPPFTPRAMRFWACGPGAAIALVRRHLWLAWEGFSLSVQRTELAYLAESGVV